MTFAELIERSKRQLNAGQPEPHVWVDSETDLAACVALAKSDVAYAVMRDDERRALLQQVYSVALNASGEGDLLAAAGSITGNAGEILLEGVRYGLVVDADGNVLQNITHYSDFVRPQSTEFGHYNIRNKATIATRAINIPLTKPADIVGATGPLSVTASYDPQDVDDFPAELEPDLVDALCKRVAVKINAPA